MTSKSEDRTTTPATLLAGFGVLIACQLVGETLVSVGRILIPAFVFPGPGAGVLLLLAFLGWRRQLNAGLDATATGLIGILSLLFVPSAVGIVQHGGLILEWGPPLLLALVISTALTLLVTVGTYLGLSRLSKGAKQ